MMNFKDLQFELLNVALASKKIKMQRCIVFIVFIENFKLTEKPLFVLGM